MTSFKRIVGMLAVALAVTLATMSVRALAHRVVGESKPAPPPPPALLDNFVRPHASPLAGTIFDDPQLAGENRDAEFQRALAKVAAESLDVPTLLAPPTVPLEQAFPATSLDSSQVGSLRTAASTLDDLAAAAEDRADYRRADSLRSLARRLRLEARSLQAGAAP